LHSFSILRFGYFILSSEEGREVDTCFDFGGKPASSQIFSFLIFPLPNILRARAARPYKLQTLFFVFHSEIRNPQSAI